MGSLKKTLKKILPPPVNSFMREVNRIVALEEKNQKTIDILTLKVTLQEQQINVLLNTLKDWESKQTVVNDLLERQIDSMVSLSNKQQLAVSKMQDEIMQRQQNAIEALYKEIQSQQEQHIDELKRMVDKQATMLTSVDRKTPQPLAYNNDWERKVIESFRFVMEKESFSDDFMNLIKGMDEESIKTIILLLKRQALVIDRKGENQFIYSKEEQDAIQAQRDDFAKYKLKVADDIYIYKNYLLPIDHFEASVFYHKHGLETIQDIESIKDKDIIDVGGFIGDSCLVLSSLTNKHVYTFESVSENYELLLKTIALNDLKNIVPEKIALGAEKKEIEINIAGSCSSIVTPSALKVDGRETVMMTSLDLYMKEHPLINPGLIKVDIEGFEQEFLKGATATIKKYKPILLISIYHNVDDFFKIKPMIESWNLGYNFKIHNPVDGSVSREVLLIAEINI